MIRLIKLIKLINWNSWSALFARNEAENPSKEVLQGNPPGKHTPFKMHFCEKMSFLASRRRFLMVLTCSWVSWPKNDTEWLWNHLKKQVLEPKRAVLVKKPFPTPLTHPSPPPIFKQNRTYIRVHGLYAWVSRINSVYVKMSFGRIHILVFP